jgi:SpoVK/Ycf46/Vps4 family AAA+-type ATPase
MITYSMTENMMAIRMRKKPSLPKSADTSDKPYEALIRLWVLRLLVPLGGSRDFMATYGYKSDDLAEYLGLESGLETFDLKRAMADLRKKHAQAERLRSPRQLPATLMKNIDRFSELLGWNEADKAVIAFVTLMETDPRLELAASMIEDSSTARLINVLTGVLGLDRDQVRNSIAPKGSLSESGFLKIDPRVTNSLCRKIMMLSDATADQLRYIDADPFYLLRDVITPTQPGELTLGDFQHVSSTLEVLRPYLKRSLENHSSGVNVFIHGAPGTGKTQLALALASDMDCDLYEMSSQNEAGDAVDGAVRLRVFRAALSMLRQRRAMILFDEAEDVFDGGWSLYKNKGSAQSQKAWMNRLLESNPVPVIWLSNNVECMDPAFLRRFDVVLEMPLPQGRQRERLLDDACGDLIDATTRCRLVEARGLAPAVVQRAARVIRTVQADLPANQASASLQRLIESTLVAQGHGMLTQGEAVALPASYDPRHIAADIDLGEVASGIVEARTGRICLYGPPGTGKTAFGRWLATQMDVPLHAKKVSDIVSPYIGQTERNLAKVFREAATEGAVLLLDEVDSFLQDRQHAQRSWEVTAVNEMLTQMESFQGVFIASTNLMDGLDQAALRRFDLKVKFDYLRPAQAWDLFEVHRQLLGLPDPDRTARSAVARLGNLTPGDFAAVTRQNRFRPLGSVDALVAALEAECHIKKDSRKPLGFM